MPEGGTQALAGLGWESLASTAGALGESVTLNEVVVEFMLTGFNGGRRRKGNGAM